jgi:hypothetical protein
MRQIHYAHDAEHEVQPEPNQTKIKAEEQASQQGIKKHQGRRAWVLVTAISSFIIRGADKPAFRLPRRAAKLSQISGVRAHQG